MKKHTIIKRWLIFFIVSLFFSGLTAIPLETGLGYLLSLTPPSSALDTWISKVYEAIKQTNTSYPFLSYGYDWLAFAHFTLAILFIGPLLNPVKNKWVIEFGIIACLLVIPFALVAGHYRSIPLWWRLIDCAFGIVGIIPLLICRNNIKKIESLNTKNK